jgi:FkbM family methyltransferase
MKSLNSLSEDQLFQKTNLFSTFKNSPLGFIDGGAAGGVHPLIMPVASLVHCTCFEPDQDAYQKLVGFFQANKIFAKFSLFDTALGKNETSASMYLTQSPVNSSLLKPLRVLVERYGIKGFNWEREIKVQTKPLDQIIFDDHESPDKLGEFIKLDCQGAEYDILQGGLRTLNEQSVALLCEVEFFQMYENQMTFSELELLLRGKGFSLYGLYPNYISTKRLNRRLFETEERTIWADALFFKDPLDPVNKGRHFSDRHLQVLIMAAILTGYYDYALELIAFFCSTDQEKDLLTRVVEKLAMNAQEDFMKDFKKLVDDFQNSPVDTYLLIKKFIDDHESNSNIDYIRM